MVMVYAFTIFLASSVPAPAPQMQFLVSDKLQHMAAFGLMAVFVAMAVQRPGKPLTWRRAIAAIAVTAAYGALDELHQTTVAGRFGTTSDALADLTGAVLAVGWYYLISRKTIVLSYVMGAGE